MAIAACPNITTKCGTRAIAAPAPGETKKSTTISNLSSNDSCHYIITTDCDVPEIKVTTNSLGAGWNFNFVEWQAETGVTMQTSSNGNAAYPDFKTVPPFYKGYESETGILPFLKLEKVESNFPATGTDTTFKRNYPFSQLIGDVAAHDAIAL